MSARLILLTLLTTFGVARACISPPPVPAQDRPRSFAAERRERDLAEVLAALAVHESGWDSPADVDGIYAVLTAGAERHGITWLAFAHRYSRRFFAGTSTRPWARSLTLEPDARVPAALRAPWLAPRAGGLPSRHDAFAILVERARALIGSPPPCAATDWGSRADFAQRRAQGRRFRIVDCGPTRNLYAVRGQS